MGSQIYRYRSISGPAQRQQTKWVICGISIVFGGFLVLVALQGVFAGFDPTGVLGGLFTQTMITVLFLMIPLSIGVAILRSRLFDIDLLINRTLVYGTLTAILIFTYLVIVVSVQYVIRTLTGQESQLAIVASTLVIATLFNPLRRRVQTFVDRRFYRRKYDAKKTLEAFSAKLREETDLGTLSDHLVGVVGETIDRRTSRCGCAPMRPLGASDPSRSSPIHPTSGKGLLGPSFAGSCIDHCSEAFRNAVSVPGPLRAEHEMLWCRIKMRNRA